MSANESIQVSSRFLRLQYQIERVNNVDEYIWVQTSKYEYYQNVWGYNIQSNEFLIITSKYERERVNTSVNE